MFLNLIIYINLASLVSGEKEDKTVHQNPLNLIIDHGDSPEIKCFHKITGYDRLLWYKQSQNKELTFMGYLIGDSGNPEKPFENKITIQGNANKLHGSLTLINATAESDSVYFCAAYTSYAKLEFGEGTKLTVLATNVTKPEVKILPPSPKELCSQNTNDKKLSTLVCVATGFYPDHVSMSWKVNDQERKDNISTDHIAIQDKTTLMYNISSRMKVYVSEWMDPNNKFTCTVRFFNGDHYINVSYTTKGQKVKPKGLKLVGFGYILFLSKSFLYALVVSAVFWKLKFSMKTKDIPEE